MESWSGKGLRLRECFRSVRSGSSACASSELAELRGQVRFVNCSLSERWTGAEHLGVPENLIKMQLNCQSINLVNSLYTFFYLFAGRHECAPSRAGGQRAEGGHTSGI